MNPANDNQPRHSDDMSLAERRAWLDTLPTHAAPVLAWPTAERLARLDNPAAAAALVRYADLDRPAAYVAANDNDEPGAEDMDVEMRHEIRPTIGEMLQAAGDGLRCRVISAKKSGKWVVVARHDRRPQTPGETRLGGLTFRSGTLASYGSTARGKPLRPREIQRAPRGAAVKPRSAESVRFLLRTDAPIANGAEFIGGITRPRGNGSRPDIGDFEAERELHRNARRDAVRLAIGPVNARVLDLAITDATARDIGEEFGSVGKVAERRAVRLINAALEKFQEIGAA